MDGATIDTYSADDRAACLAVFDSNVPRWFGEAERPEFEAFLDDLPGPYLVLRAGDGQVVGCGGFAVTGDGARADLCWGMVHADHHGRGLGDLLARARLARAAAHRGVREVTLRTSQLTTGFYERLGFVLGSVEPDGFGPGLDRCEMVLRTDGATGAPSWIGRALVTACVALAGCGVGEPAALPPTVTDSAGVRVVTHTERSPRRFMTGASPRLAVGLGGDGDATLFGVQGGTFLEDGGFVVADGGNYRLLRWSGDGMMIDSLGGRGAGPGELENVSWMQVTDDGLVTYDARSRRLTWFDPADGFLRSIQVKLARPEAPTDDAIITSGAPIGVVAGSGFVGYPMAWADPTGERGPLPLWADLAVYDSTSTETGAVGRFQVMEWFEDPTLDRFPLANRLETPRIYWAARGALLAVTDAAGHRIDLMDDGRRRTAIIEARSRLPFLPDSIPERYHLAADSLPAYRDVRIDRERRVWVKPAVREGTDSTTWRVFTVDGEDLGGLTLPTDARVLDADRGAILLLRRSELDVESIEVRDLLPAGAR